MNTCPHKWNQNKSCYACTGIIDRYDETGYADGFAIPVAANAIIGRLEMLASKERRLKSVIPIRRFPSFLR